MIDTRKRSKKMFRCKKCGGQVICDWAFPDPGIEWKCRNCGAEHYEDEELIIPQIAEPTKYGKRYYPTKRAYR